MEDEARDPQELPPSSGRRLSLRGLAEADAPGLFDAISSSRAHLRKRLSWIDSFGSIDDAREFISRSRGEAAAGSGAVFGIFKVRTGQLLGVAALQEKSPLEGKAEFSCWIKSQDVDRGYATEAGRLVERFAFAQAGLERLYARIDPRNRAARRLLQKLGFSYEGCLRREKKLNGRRIDQECWGMLKSEWRGLARV